MSAVVAAGLFIEESVVQVEDAIAREQIKTGELTCGCGKPVRYMVGMNPEVWACNKHFRCLTYDELVMKRAELYAQLREAKKYCTKLLDLQSQAGRNFTGNHEFCEAADWREVWRFIQTLP